MSKSLHHIVRRAFNSTHDNYHDTDSAWNKVKQECNPKRKHPFLLSAIKYAAGVIILISIGTFYWYHLPQETPLNMNTRFASENTQAELILATGERIRLENTRHDICVEELSARINQNKITGDLRSSSDSRPEDKIQNALNQLNVPKGGEYTLKLPDGSIVKLNSESSFKFPTQFTPDSRDVYLDGEAFFEIMKNEEAPFTVHTGNREVTVLGTRFNVSAYSNDLSWQTTLVEGKVAIRSEGTKQLLLPSQQCSIDNSTGKIDINTVDTELYTSWMNGKFHFKGYRFEDIVKKLERWYDFQMQYGQEDIKEMRFRGVINKDRPLEETLRYLEETTNIRFNINGKMIRVEKTDK